MAEDETPIDIGLVSPPRDEPFHLDADVILQNSIGKLESAVIVGLDEEGSIRIRSTDGLAHTVLLLELSKLTLLSGG